MERQTINLQCDSTITINSKTKNINLNHIIKDQDRDQEEGKERNIYNDYSDGSIVSAKKQRRVDSISIVYDDDNDDENKSHERRKLVDHSLKSIFSVGSDHENISFSVSGSKIDLDTKSDRMLTESEHYEGQLHMQPSLISTGSNSAIQKIKSSSYIPSCTSNDENVTQSVDFFDIEDNNHSGNTMASQPKYNLSKSMSGDSIENVPSSHFAPKHIQFQIAERTSFRSGELPLIVK